MKKNSTYDYPIKETRNFLGIKLKKDSGFNIVDVENNVKEIFGNLINKIFNLSFKDGTLTINNNYISFELKEELFSYNISQSVVESVQTICEEILYQKMKHVFTVKIFSQYIDELSFEDYLKIALEACETAIETDKEVYLPLMSKEIRSKIHEQLIRVPNIVSKSVNIENKRLIKVKKKDTKNNN